MARLGLLVRFAFRSYIALISAGVGSSALRVARARVSFLFVIALSALPCGGGLGDTFCFFFYCKDSHFFPYLQIFRGLYVGVFCPFVDGFGRFVGVFRVNDC